MVESTATNPQLLADQVSQLLVQPLEAASVVLSGGPPIFDTAGVLRIPKLTKSSTVGFIGENQLIPSDHDTTFDEVVLMPTDRKSIKVIERYSRGQAVIGIDVHHGLLSGRVRHRPPVVRAFQRHPLGVGDALVHGQDGRSRRRGGVPRPRQLHECGPEGR